MNGSQFADLLRTISETFSLIHTLRSFRMHACANRTALLGVLKRSDVVHPDCTVECAMPVYKLAIDRRQTKECGRMDARIMFESKSPAEGGWSTESIVFFI